MGAAPYRGDFSSKILSSLAIVLALAFPAVSGLIFVLARTTAGDADEADAASSLAEARQALRLLPPAFPRPEEFSPFGQAFKDGPILAAGDAPGRLRMNIGRSPSEEG